MIEQNGNALNFYAFFVSNRVGATSQTITVDVYDGTTDLVVTGASATELGGGFYKYTLASTDNAAEGELFALFKSTDSNLDQQQIPAIWVIDKGGVDNLDAALSTVATLGAGSIAYTLTVTVGGAGLDGVDVWVTSDVAGTTVIARGDTNDSGQVTFQLDAGTYYAWKQLAGYTFTNPETITVST